jgi:hypothetical protein
MDEWSEAVILTNGRPLWVGLTEEQFLRARMSDAQRRRAHEIDQRRQEGTPQFSDEESLEMIQLRQFEKELAALTPGERQQPAPTTLPRRRTSHCSPGSPGATPPVRD